MKKYEDLNGNSGISAYQIGGHWINVKFKHGKTFKYSYKIPGEDHVEQMKKLALQGRGLATYINKYVRELYEESF